MKKYIILSLVAYTFFHLGRGVEMAFNFEGWL